MGAQLLTNAKSLATRQRFRAKQVDAALQAQARKWGSDVKARAMILSNGPLTTAQLRRYRPGLYSTQLPPRAVFDALVNRQSGEFARSWRIRVASYAGHITVTVLNDADDAKWMQGTSKMRLRPILKLATSQVSSLTKRALTAKQSAEQAATGGSLFLELVKVSVTVGAAYGGAAADG